MLSDLKEFEKFLKICRKQGVTDVSFDGVSVKLGDAPVRMAQAEEIEESIEPTEEEIMNYHLRSISG